MNDHGHAQLNQFLERVKARNLISDAEIGAISACINDVEGSWERLKGEVFPRLNELDLEKDAGTAFELTNDLYVELSLHLARHFESAGAAFLAIAQSLDAK